MCKAEWWSQPMRPDGDNTGVGILNQLGRSQYGEYAVLVREAVQNIWDARIANTGVSVRFSLSKLGGYSDAWRELLGQNGLPGYTGEALRAIQSDSPILVISDRGTVGLGGPLRSDEPIGGEEKANFVQFLRNVGEPRDTALGGGTYGYGKASFFRVSEGSTILVNSSCTGSVGRSRRLMGAALTDPFTSVADKRFTGRHWWGKVNAGIPDPLLGTQADRVAAALGLPGFEELETGTDIVVLLPKLDLEAEDENLESLAERLRGHIYWHLWPKFPTSQRNFGIDFSVNVGGKELDMPHPNEIPILGDFVKALDQVAARRATPYRLKKYGANDLGELSIDHALSPRRSSLDPVVESILGYCPFDLNKPVCHVATMRQAELVVDYVGCTPIQGQDVGYVGVFRACAIADDAFANAEPPAHDSWTTTVLTGNQLGIVRGAKIFIRKQAEAFAAAKGEARSKTIEGLGKVSNELGGLLPSGSGTRADTTGKLIRSARSRTSFQQRRFWRVGPSQVVIRNGTPTLEARLNFLMPPPDSLKLVAQCQILLANRQKENPEKAPLGTRTPRFLGWFNSESDSLVESLPILSDATSLAAEMYVRFEFLPGTASRIVVVEDV